MLDANVDYTLTIDHRARTTFEIIPEPGMLSLFGAMLLGLGLVRRRNNKA